jgi:hypothetical protein
VKQTRPRHPALAALTALLTCCGPGMRLAASWVIALVLTAALFTVEVTTRHAAEEAQAARMHSGLAAILIPGAVVVTVILTAVVFAVAAAAARLTARQHGQHVYCRLARRPS